MSFFTFLKHKTRVLLIAIPTVIITCIYILALAGALMGGLGNDEYSTPLIIQAAIWIAWLFMMASYGKFCEKNNQEPSKTANDILVWILLGLTIIGLILGELYSGFYFGRYGMFS